jgi:hypothetical protein
VRIRRDKVRTISSAANDSIPDSLVKLPNPATIRDTFWKLAGLGVEGLGRKKGVY